MFINPIRRHDVINRCVELAFFHEFRAHFNTFSVKLGMIIWLNTNILQGLDALPSPLMIN